MSVVSLTLYVSPKMDVTEVQLVSSDDEFVVDCQVPQPFSAFHVFNVCFEDDWSKHMATFNDWDTLQNFFGAPHEDLQANSFLCVLQQSRLVAWKEI